MRTIKTHWPVMLLATSLLLLVGGAAGMMLFSSIPGPDDPPAQAAREATTGKIAFAVMLLGVLTFTIGAVAGLWRLLFRRRQ